MLVAAMDHIETGWRVAVRELQRWVEANREHERGRSDYAHLLSYVDGELRDAFRRVAGTLADVALSWPGWERASVDDVADQVDTFVRNLAVLRLASAPGAAVPEPFRALVHRAAETLESSDWSGRMYGILDQLRTLAPEPPLDPRWAVELLVGGLPEEQRRHAGGFLVLDLEGIYAAAGKPWPEWMGVLKHQFLGPKPR
ncbi:MAG TPA: hypothetical protein VF006_13365 [Longimicrobium sp.]